MITPVKQQQQPTRPPPSGGVDSLGSDTIGDPRRGLTFPVAALLGRAVGRHRNVSAPPPAEDADDDDDNGGGGDEADRQPMNVDDNSNVITDTIADTDTDTDKQFNPAELSPRTLARIGIGADLAPHRIDKSPGSGAVSDGRIHMLHPDDFYATDGLDKEMQREFGHLGTGDGSAAVNDTSAAVGSASDNEDDDDDELSALTPIQMDLLESLDRQYAADGAQLHFDVDVAPEAHFEHDAAATDEDLKKEQRVSGARAWRRW